MANFFPFSLDNFYWSNFKFTLCFHCSVLSANLSVEESFVSYNMFFPSISIWLFFVNLNRTAELLLIVHANLSPFPLDR